MFIEGDKTLQLFEIQVLWLDLFGIFIYWIETDLANEVELDSQVL